MTTSNAHLIYGILLGGDETGWNVKDLNENDLWRPHFATLTAGGYWPEPVQDVSRYLAEQMLDWTDGIQVRTAEEALAAHGVLVFTTAVGSGSLLWLATVHLEAGPASRVVEHPFANITHSLRLEIAGKNLGATKPLELHLVSELV